MDLCLQEYADAFIKAGFDDTTFLTGMKKEIGLLFCDFLEMATAFLHNL